MNHGSVAYASPYEKGKRSRPAWIVSCPPHVRTRLKRAFARVSPAAGDRVMIADTPEACRDLAWFLDRFRMECQASDYLASRAEGHRERERAVEEVLSEGYVPPKVELALPLRDYQRTAVDLHLRSGGLLIGDDVGLGKTATSIGSLSDPRALPALVVTLTHLPRQWQAEIAKFAPNLRVVVAKSGRPYDLPKPGTYDVLISNYHKLNGIADAIAPHIRHVIFDECQELRHADSLKYKAAKHVADHANFRQGLSATPIYNYGGEIWSVLDCIAPDTLGTREEFVREWCGGSGPAGRPALADPRAFGLYARDAGLMIRRTRSEVGRELPAISRFTQPIDADLSEIDRIADDAAELARVILAQGGREKGEQLRASEQFSLKLRQATGIAKAASVAAVVRMMVEAGEKVLLYGWHREVYSRWMYALKDYNPGFYTGSEGERQKAESKRRFISGETPILIMSLRAGAGLDGLQDHCRTVVFGELDWSPGCIQQCIGRVHRDGQADPVAAYFLVSDSGSDPIMVDVLGLKRDQLEGITDPNAANIEALQVDAGAIKRLAADFLARRGLPADAAFEEVAA